MPSRIAARISSDRDASTGVKMTMQRVDFVSGGGHFDRLPVFLRARRRHHVDGIADARRRREKRAEPGARGGRELGDGQAGRDARVDGQDARSAGVRDDRDAAALRERLGVETRRDVEHLVDRVGADDAGLVEQGLDGRVARGQRGGVAAGRARAGTRPSGLDRHDRLGSADAARETREAPRVAERFEIQQDHARARVAFPVLQQIVARDVGLVADADELGQSDLAGRPPARESRGPGRRSATRSARCPCRGNIGENDALSLTAGSVFSSPMQLGPTIRMP